MRRWLPAFVLLTAGALLGGLAGHSLLKGEPASTPPMPKELTSYRDVVKKVLPAVVSIEGKSAVPVKAKAPRKRSDEPQVPDEFRHFFGDSDVEPTPQLGFGSGFIVDPQGRHPDQQPRRRWRRSGRGHCSRMAANS